MKKLLLLLFLLPALAFGQATGYVLSNFATSGSIGTAAATVDVYSRININQTTPSITLSVPNPTNTTTKVVEVWIGNIGTVPFTLNHGGVIDTASMVILKWTGVNYTIVGKKPIGGGTVTSVTGTTNRITSTGGTTPVIDIDASYAGQSSINTVGTVTTGTWQGTPIADAFVGSSANWNTAYTNRITSLTTTGTSGSSTLSSNVLNIPTYTIGGLAGSQSANLVYRSGNAGGVPTFSSLSLADMPLFTGYTAGTTQQTVTSSDNAFTAVQKLDGNVSVISNPVVGIKYSDNFTRAALGPNYTQAGSDATFSIVANKLSVTGGAIPADFTNRIEYTPYATIPTKNELKLTYTIGDVNTGGLAFGFRTGLEVWLDTRTSSSSVLKLYRGGVLVNSVSLSNPNVLNCLSGDNITLTLIIDKYVVTASAYNDRLKSTIAIQYDYTYILNDAIDIGRPSPISIYAMGGAHTASFATAIDNSPKNKSLIGIGNSIMFGAGPFSAKRSYFDRIENTFQNVTKIASSGISAGQYCGADMLAELTSQAVNCPYALIVCATNGLGAGSTPATEIGYVNQLIAALQAGNPSIVVYVGTELPRPAIQATIDSYNALVKSTYANVIDFASVVQSGNLSDGVHPNDAAAQYMYSLMLSTFRGKIKLINGDNEYQSIYSTGVDYRLNSNAALTLSSNISNTDVTIPVTNVAGLPPFGFASISDGVTSEIIYYGGISGINLTGVLRARFATTAMTVAASPTNFKVKYITSLTSQETNVLPKSINYDNFVGYNTTGPLSANDVYYFSMGSQTNPVYRIGVGSGGSMVISKASAATSGSIMFGVGSAYSFRIMHDNQGFLQIGAFSNNIGFTINSTMSSFGIKTKDYTYRLTNAGGNVASTFLVDIEGDKTISNNWGLDATNGLVYSKGNGANRIAIGALTPIGVDVATPGSEFGDLGIYTKASSGAMALRARFNSTGIVTTGVTATTLIGTGTAPTIAAGVGAGTGPTLSVTGTDLAGYITITTGTSPTGSNAIIATITFATAKTSAPIVILSPGDRFSNGIMGTTAWPLIPVAGETNGTTTTTYVLESNSTPLTAGTTYKFKYQTIQ